MTNGTNAEIYDQGYRVYDGPRTGVRTAVFSVWKVSVQRALGLRRKFRFKIIPAITIFISFVPALVFLGISVVFPAELADQFVDFSGYFGLTGVATVLFTAFVTPELLISDRQSGMFGIYMASPLDRGNYLWAKLQAIVGVISTVTLLPVVFLLIGYLLVGVGPEGFSDIASTGLRIALSGLSVALFYSLIGMAVATLTNKAGVGSAVVIMLFLVSAFLANALVDVADAPDWVLAFSLFQLPGDIAARIFDEPINQLNGVSTAASVSVFVATLVLSLVIVWSGYKRVEVSK